jgi:hypothetical protein
VGKGIYATWEIQKIVVDKVVEGGLSSHDFWTRSVFPCYAWVKPGGLRCFFEGTAHLPHRTPLWYGPVSRPGLQAVSQKARI